MSEEFRLIKSIQLKESNDHFTIMIINENNPICQPLPHKFTSDMVKLLCRFFNIKYTYKWSYGGNQIHIPKVK
jgi:hypothetical protein